MNLPHPFQNQMKQLLGEDYERFLRSHSDPLPVSVRLNRRKLHSLGKDKALFTDMRPVGWCEEGRYLSERPIFTADPRFHAGCYYVQEASSMFIEQFAVQHAGDAPIVALDLCAAPGGKSTLLSSLLPAGSLLMANEIVRNRCLVLAENLIKWGDAAIIVTNNSPMDYQQSGLAFDLILCDAPCSGEGMFRKDTQAIEEWSEESVKRCAARQQDILRTAWNCLKPGGLLIYSTCTYNSLEDEQNASFLACELGGIPLSVAIDTSWGIDTANRIGADIPVYHFFPHKTEGEGFFACGFRKPSDADSPVKPLKIKKERTRRANQSGKVTDEVRKWLLDADRYAFETAANGAIHAFPQAHSQLLTQAKEKLRVVHYGVEMAIQKGKSVRPAHSLAMSRELNKDCFPQVNLDSDHALSYLRGESLTLEDCPRGIVLVTYDGYSLGFVNNLGSRANNLYPDAWRIRHY